MSGIEEHIGEVLATHALHFEHYPKPYACSCDCEPFSFLPEYCAHVASVLVAELGLTEEWCTRHESGGGGIYTNIADARRFLKNFIKRPPAVEDPGSGRYVGIEHRYVTPWEVS